MMNKLKIVNDPVWGFIQIPNDLTYDIISHPYFQRLRRIAQMGLSFYVYPGATHNRFNHSLGCFHLMQQCLDTLRGKGVEISKEEEQAACLAILLHDMGHGPCSHALEHSFLSQVSHEEISLLFMERLNEEMGHRLDLTIAIFKNEYPRKFFHQLISGQLDMDRVDYLNRDCFYSGVLEGAVGTERIIKMLHVANDELVVEEKGIYSIEKFILSRRLMYWQVYLHKTSVCAEQMLIRALRRLRQQPVKGEVSPHIKFFLENDFSLDDFKNRPDLLDRFARLDDHDLWYSIKESTLHPDRVVRFLCQSLYNRNLFKTELSQEKFSEEHLQKLRQKIMEEQGFAEADLEFLLFEKILSPTTYNTHSEGINIVRKNKKIVDITRVSELLDKHFVDKTDVKYLLCYPRFQ